MQSSHRQMANGVICTCSQCGIRGREVSARTRRQHELNDERRGPGEGSSRYEPYPQASQQPRHQANMLQPVDLAEGLILGFQSLYYYLTFDISYCTSL